MRGKGLGRGFIYRAVQNKQRHEILVLGLFFFF